MIIFYFELRRKMNEFPKLVEDKIKQYLYHEVTNVSQLYSHLKNGKRDKLIFIQYATLSIERNPPNYINHKSAHSLNPSKFSHSFGQTFYRFDEPEFTWLNKPIFYNIQFQNLDSSVLDVSDYHRYFGQTNGAFLGIHNKDYKITSAIVLGQKYFFINTLDVCNSNIEKVCRVFLSDLSYIKESITYQTISYENGIAITNSKENLMIF